MVMNHAPLRLALLPLLLLPLGGCLSVERGDTVLRVKAGDREEEKALRRELWRVEKAVAEVRVHYGLEDIAIEVTVTEMGGLGQTSPLVSGLSVSGASFVMNKRLFLEQHPDLDDIVLGLTSHELAHALHYARMSDTDLIELGLTYDSMLKHPEGPHKDWVRAYEQLTDMTAIAMGYGEVLIHQKSASEANLAANHPEHVWDFYLHEHEIRALMADEAELLRKMEEAMVVLALPSLRRFLEHPRLDADGDLTR